MSWFLGLFLSVFYIVGFVVLGLGLSGAYWSTVAGNWPTTPGAIRRAELKESGDSDGSTWSVEVEYTYQVNGQAFEGSRLAFGYCGSSEQESHQAVLRKLQGAKSVDVRYDPADPSNSCLSYGIHTSIRFLVIFGITWLAFIIGFTMIAWTASSGDTVLLENLATK